MIFDEQSSKRTAYHEAGHYVAMWAMMREQAGEDHYTGEAITIFPNEELGTLGHVTPLYEDIETVEGVRTYLVSLYAGGEAERILMDDPKLESPGSWSDKETVAEYLDLIPDSGSDLRRAANEILTKNWEVVERLASELIEHGTLNADEADFVCSDEMEYLNNVYRRHFQPR